MTAQPDSSPAARVPVLLLTGSVAAGKTVIGSEAARILRTAGISHAYVDLPRIGQYFPPPPDDPWNERMTHRNLACMWENFRQAGARRLILARILDNWEQLLPIAEAIPGAEITVVRLCTSLLTIETRIRTREAGREASWYFAVARELTETMELSVVEDYVVKNEDRSTADVAREVLECIGWLKDR